MMYIAEIGVNHNGSVKTATHIIDTIYKIYCKRNLKARVAIKFQLWGEHQFPAIEHLRLSEEDIQYLFDYCNQIIFNPFATAFSKKSLTFLKGKQNLWKVPSGMFDNVRYIYELLKHFKDNDLLFVSDGIKNAGTINNNLPVNAIRMYCVSKYPTNYSDINLNNFWDSKLHALKSTYYNVYEGFSDHTPTIDTSVAACALGAKYIEKHVTLNQKAEGPDHSSSITPAAFVNMISMCENIKKAFTGGENKSKNYKKIKEAMSNWEAF